MKIEEAKQLLESGGFRIREGQMCVTIGRHETKESIIGVEVSTSHQCFDPDCQGVHIVGTRLAIESMHEDALRQMINELASSR